MLVSVLVIFVFFVLLLIFVCDRYNHASRLVRKIPGPKRLPVFGNSIHFLLPLDALFKYLRTLHKDYGDVNQMHAIHARTIGFFHPNDIETILSSMSYSDKQMPYIFLKPWLGEGLLTSQGSKWQKRRKLLTQAFHFNILKKYSITFIEQAEKFMQQIDRKVGEEKSDIVPLITSTTLRIMCATAMGIPTQESLESVASRYCKSIETIGESIVKRLCRIWLHINWVFKLTDLSKAQTEAIRDIHSFTNSIIRERRIYLQKNNINVFENDDTNANKGRLAMLDLLLEAEKTRAIDVEGIREEVDTFMFEGHDTTAQALSYLIMNIANENEVQEKIYEEMTRIFGDSQRMPTTDELNEMKYLECCIKESLRLYPSVPIILRYSSKETKIGNYTIPANSHVHISIYDLHRRPEIYPDPEKFIPERFLPENSIKRHPYAYIPFSAGPRNCIGQKFAMLEIKTLVSTLLRHYRIEPVTKPTDLVFRTDIILRTNNK